MSVDTEIEAPKRTAAEAQTFKIQRRQARTLRLFEPALVRMATLQSFVMLDPRNMMRNPVMFLVEVGTVLTAIVTVQSIVQRRGTGLIVYQAALTLLLLLTVLFANFAEALAEARGKAQADSLRATRHDTPAYRLDGLGMHTGQVVSSTKLRAGDYVVVEAGQVIPADGEVVEGVASVDEVGHHRRECPGDPRGRRRPLRRHRRHPRPLRPDRRSRSRPSRARASSTG